MQNTLSLRIARKPRRRKHIVTTTCIDRAQARRDLYNRYVGRLRNRIHGSRWFLAKMREPM